MFPGGPPSGSNDSREFSGSQKRVALSTGISSTEDSETPVMRPVFLPAGRVQPWQSITAGLTLTPAHMSPTRGSSLQLCFTFLFTPWREHSHPGESVVVGCEARAARGPSCSRATELPAACSEALNACCLAESMGREGRCWDWEGNTEERGEKRQARGSACGNRGPGLFPLWGHAVPAPCMPGAADRRSYKHEDR